MEDEQRVALDVLVMQYELLYASMDWVKTIHDPRLIYLERKIRRRAAACNDPAIESARVVGGLWYFGPNDK